MRRDEGILTVPEAAQFLGIPKRRMYKIMAMKRVKYIRYFKYAYFKIEDLEELKAKSLTVVIPALKSEAVSAQENSTRHLVDKRTHN